MAAGPASPVRYGSRYGSDGQDGQDGPAPSHPPCQGCGQPVLFSRRASYCSNACKQRAYRSRHLLTMSPAGPSTSRPSIPRHDIVYQCPECEERFLGEQRCPNCNVFCRRLGPGGPCPHCAEPVAVSDLLTSAPTLPVTLR